MRQLIIALSLGVIFVRPSMSQDNFSITSGVAIIRFQQPAIDRLGISVDFTRVTDTTGGPAGLGFIIRAAGGSQFTVNGSQIVPEGQFNMPLFGGIVLAKRAKVLRANDFSIRLPNDTHAQGEIVGSGSAPATSEPLFVFNLDKLQFVRSRSALSLGETDLMLTQAGANALGLPNGEGTTIGSISFDATSNSRNGSSRPKPATVTPSSFPDLTFCALDSLGQYSRDGDVVGLALSTTSWNVGNIPLDWYQNPSFRHPFIDRSLYRISDDKIEQIGESGVKHGFFALSDKQCDAKCPVRTDGRTLGLDCTDTYSAETTADQSWLGPRYEINPWEGSYDPRTSNRGKAKTPVQFLLRVHDKDLDLTSQYLVEAYYVHYQDMNTMNNAAWKPVKVTSGNPGGTWTFEMSGEDTRPTIGFAVDGWKGAKQTVIAQEVPPVKGHSPDGRSILAAKPHQLPDGRWRYEYAILNVDMDRQISGLDIPIPQGTNVSEITFHAPEHDGEDFDAVGGIATDNAPWASGKSGDSVTWTTSTNPLTWGNLYSFGFTADAAPGSSEVTLHLFKSGNPDSLKAKTSAPAVHQ